MMKAKRRENGKGEVQYFAGLVKCADCGSSLNVSYDKKRGRYTGFSCWVYKNYGKDRCTSHAIGWKMLNKLYEDAALERISEERYQSMASTCEREQETLKGQREALSAEIAQGRELLENGVWCEQETPNGRKPVFVKPA